MNFDVFRTLEFFSFFGSWRFKMTNVRKQILGYHSNEDIFLDKKHLRKTNIITKNRCTEQFLTYLVWYITQRWTQLFAHRAHQTKRQRRVLRTTYSSKLSKTYTGRLWKSFLMLLELLGFCQFPAHGDPKWQTFASKFSDITAKRTFFRNETLKKTIS